ARITVELSALQSEGENYVLAYTCKKYNNQWKCGCRSENDCGYWMLETFTLAEAEIPSEPQEPRYAGPIGYTYP
ncbi:hypothetical protein KY345_03695, partial [Candidatus Woesearchaeota archaeon]|nr:hypothetical protein [Candidatus Woesearchaeota archaeon]